MPIDTTWNADPREFAIRAKRQREWSWLIAIALFLAGVGSGTFIMAELVLGSSQGALIGILTAGIGSSLAFFLDLNRKSQFWRVMFRPQTSWISRGIILIMLFTVFGLLYLISSNQVFLWIAIPSALGVMMYSGFVLSYSSSIPFWNTPLLPLISILYALMGGTGLLFALSPGSPNIDRLELIGMGLLVTAAILIFTYLMTMSTSTVAARDATRTLVAGSLAIAFWGLVVAGGILIPFSLAYVVQAYGLSANILVVAGLLELAGGLTFRYCLLKSGVMLALA